jgi:alkylation response protein AidB-like acyl-CoA dehydrogenase
MTHSPRIPERDQLLKAVDEIGEVVRANADAAEDLRHLPEASVEALEEAGIFRLVVPRELGGYEADPVTQHEVIDRLAYHDASTGWCGFIGAGSSAFAAGNIPDEGLQEVQASLPTGSSWTRFAGSPVPAGQATPVEGGYRVSGRWPWASGIHHSSWVFAGAAILKDGEIEMSDFGFPNGRLMVMPRADIELEDTWHTAGLRGTGSCHFNAQDVFVPEHRTIDFPFPQPKRGGPVFRLPVLGFFGPAFSGFPQGVGRRALDDIVELARSKTRMGRQTSTADRAVFQRDLALATIRLSSAGLLVRTELESLWQRLHDGVDDSALDTPRRLAAFSTGSDAANEAAELAYRYGGGEALFSASPLQRTLRDMRAAGQHMLVSESNYEGFGKAIVDDDRDD